jgi:ABC-2 type transport system ATP-binding protein
MALWDKRETPTYLLPGGWKQRLALACAILHEPPILFLDEPTSGVDPLARRAFWDLIYGLSEAGRTVFVTTHYMDEVELCHRVALMDTGRIIALDTPASLRRSLTNYCFLQLETSNLTEALRLLGEERGLSDVAVFGGGLRLRVRDEVAARSLVHSLLSHNGIDIRHLERVEPNMEDVFVSRIEATEEDGK